jgi:hypothetical protein
LVPGARARCGGVGAARSAATARLTPPARYWPSRPRPGPGCRLRRARLGVPAPLGQGHRTARIAGHATAGGRTEPSLAAEHRKRDIPHE